MRPPSATNFVTATATAVVLTAVLAGCSGGGLGILAPGPLAYQQSNAIAPSGYSETMIAPDHYRIEVKGAVNTPKERLEKIAATRAAEIGKENRLGFFKVDNVQYTTTCKSYLAPTAIKGEMERKNLQHAVLTADVIYTKAPPDRSYVEAKQVFDQYRAELDADTIPPPPIDPAAPVQCG